MSDVNLIRKRVQQARELAQQGKYAQAKTLLKGVDHPKVLALVAQLDARIAVQPPTIRKFPLLSLIGVFGVVLVFVVGGILLAAASRSIEKDDVLPTLIPTVDCTSETIRTWWKAREIELTQFAADASSASRTMPGERLTMQISNLRQFRDNFPTRLPCAGSELQTAVSEVLKTMDTTILAAQRWNDGVTDGTQATIEFYDAETKLRQATTRVRVVFSH
jgi:hypothetical protein